MTKSLFEQLGSLSAVKQLANTFYDVMDKDPAYLELRVLHPQKLTTTKKKLYRLLAHWLGGPALLTVEPPSAQLLERRHHHIDLNDRHAALWLDCMQHAMRSCELNTQLQQQLNHRFSSMIKAMQQQRKTIKKAPN